jgi:hypothetical protein
MPGVRSGSSGAAASGVGGEAAADGSFGGAASRTAAFGVGDAVRPGGFGDAAAFIRRVATIAPYYWCAVTPRPALATTD